MELNALHTCISSTVIAMVSHSNFRLQIGCTNSMCLCTRDDLNACTDCRNASANIYLAK